MLPHRRTFESEKQQLQQLNNRLLQYLSRTQQLEQENARLLAEISHLRQARTTGREPGYKAELRDLRRMLDRMSLEKSQVELEKERLWRELQMVQGLCSQQTEVCRDISGELRGYEKELHLAHKTNSALQQRLLHLQNQCTGLEDAHRQEMEHLRRQAASREVQFVTRTHRGLPAASAEEVQEYARQLSEGWTETFEMYQQKVEEMEQSMKEDQLMLSELQREKMMYASELDRLRTDAEKQEQIQSRLEEQLMELQEKVQMDAGEYQMVIEQLEHERKAMTVAIEEKMREHQQLLQVKMDLGMEVAAYRALLEGERVGLQDAHRRVNQHQRERIIEIKMPAKPYAQRASTSVRQPMDSRFSPSATHLRSRPVPHSGSRSPSRVIPISVASRNQHQSPASRRDMISFSKARAAAATAASAPGLTTTEDKRETQISQAVLKTTTEETAVKSKQVSQAENQSSPVKSETKSVEVVSPLSGRMSVNTKDGAEKETGAPGEKEEENENDRERKDEEKVGGVVGPSDKKVLDSVSVEEIIEKVIKPAGLEAKMCSSGESTITYHVRETEQDDGTTKTQIVLESKVEEELDVSEDSALEELLSQGVRKVLLEDIEDTATGSMIKDLLSTLQGEGDLQNKSVNVEIIEEPVESHTEEEREGEQKLSNSFYEPTSTYFQIEELENAPHDAPVQRTEDDIMKIDTVGSRGGSTQDHLGVTERESSSVSHEDERHEYFVSTPDDNLSDPEEGGGITSYGHYGLVDDLSDERYYQDESLPLSREIVEESEEYKITPGDRPFKESFPECIIEEEVRVSPVVQESVLEFLREDSLEPKEQLRGALERLQGSVSGPLREELAFLTKVSGESSHNVAVDVKRVQQSSDDGTMTIVAELNVSQSLEDSGLLEGDDLSEEQILAALKSSNLEKAFQGGAGGGYSFSISKEEDSVFGDEFEGFTGEGETEEQFPLGPSESFMFQVEGPSSHTETTSDRGLEKPVMISHDKTVASLYLENTTDD